MNVLQINTSLNGGSGKAALRLHQSLLNYTDIKSKFLTLEAHTSEVESKIISNNIIFVQQKLNSLSSFLINYGRLAGKERLSPLSSFLNVQKYQEVISADIIHLHWTNGFINLGKFLEKVDKPIVVTLHDMWYFTGGCHYSDGCMKFRELCQKCPETKDSLFKLNTSKSLIKKKQFFKKKEKITIICLSKWLMQLSLSSKILSGLEHHLVPNSVDSKTFSVHERKELRRKYNIPLEKKVLLFISGNKNHYRKGTDLLQATFDMVSRNQQEFFIVGAGHNILNLDQSIYRSFGRVSDEKKLSELYALSDVFLMPSREDNLPNVALESLACGTPVIAFNRGGVKDIITNRFNGLLVDEISSISFRDNVFHFLRSFSGNREDIRRDVIERYSPQKQVTMMKAIYESLLQ